MARYIDAEVTKEVLSSHEDRRGYLIGDFEQIIDEEVPTSDVVERKRGKWLLEKIYEDEHGIEEFNYFCSECGAPAYEFSQPYCHRCGAKMRKTEAKYEQEALSRL